MSGTAVEVKVGAVTRKGNVETWLCACGAKVSGEVLGKDLHKHYVNGGWRLKGRGNTRSAQCGKCSGVLAAREAKKAEAKKEREEEKAEAA